MTETNSACGCGKTFRIYLKTGEKLLDVDGEECGIKFYCGFMEIYTEFGKGRIIPADQIEEITFTKNILMNR